MPRAMPGISDKHLLETTPGLQLQLGVVSFMNGAALVTAQNIEEHYQASTTNSPVLRDTVENNSDYYNVVIANIPTPGDTVPIVLPLIESISPNSRMRQFMPTSGWNDFEGLNDNVIMSAPGSLGACPPPNDPLYESGLKNGYYCVQLNISDGGPNDLDGIRNGQIESISGVAFIRPPAPSGGGGGGGCTLNPRSGFDPLLLLIFLAAGYLSTRRRRLR